MSRIELSVSCRSLLNKDATSKSDPCCVLFMMEKDQWFEVPVLVVAFDDNDLRKSEPFDMFSTY